MSFYTNSTCSALDAFKLSSLQEFFIDVVYLFASGILISIALVIFYIRNQKKQLNGLFYFTVLALVIAIPLMFTIYKNLNDVNSSIKEKICDKAMDDGMYCTFEDLNRDEYIFMTKDSHLPILPIEAEKIFIKYWRDDFFGEYSIVISMWIPGDYSEFNYKDGWTNTQEKTNGFVRFVYAKENY